MARYIKSFILPYLDKKNCYPYSILSPKKLRHIEFEPVTIFYGSNGSGKSTLLNIIARKLNLEMNDKGNDSQYLQSLINDSSYQIDYAFKPDDTELPEESRFIRSEEVMNAIVRQRKKNDSIKEHLKSKRPDLYRQFFESGPNGGLGVWSDDNWVYRVIERFDNGRSNGELAFEYFQNNIGMNSLTLLDEPENSMSPKYQKELAKMIEDYAHYFRCQFIIATHSHFCLQFRM